MGNPHQIKTKDYFSAQAKSYATYRPTYPEKLYEFIFSNIGQKEAAWDCATGNGQVAKYLSQHFNKVFATDISQQQLNNAALAKNITYSISPAEKTPFADNQFDLITVAQALHWFDLGLFYREVNRVSKPGGLLAVWGYNMLSISPDIDKLILDFYHNVVGAYWDSARKLVEKAYKNMPFPFEEIPAPTFYSTFSWTFQQLEGYLTTWSSTQKYIQQNNFNPIVPLAEKISSYWKPGEFKSVSFPVFLRTARVIK